MPQALDDQAAAHEALTQLRRPRVLSALLTAEAVAKVEGDKPKTNGGRWCLNAGSEMTTFIWGVNTGRDGYPQPVRCVLDLAGVSFETPKIPSLFAHASWALIGNWSGLTVDPSGIFGDQTIYLPKDASEAPAFTDSIRVKSFMDQDHPWQASVGCYPADGLAGYELVDDGDEIQLNGRTYAGAGDLPLYVMRKPVVFEASVVLWGADGATGRIAASLINPLTLRATGAAPVKESTMSDIKRLQGLLASYKGHEALVAQQFADGKTDTEIATAVVKAQGERIAQLEAAAAAKPAAAPAPVATPAAPSAAVTAAAAAASTGPTVTPPAAGAGAKTFQEARAELQAEQPKLKGIALNEAVFKRYPSLRPDTSRFGSIIG